MTKEEAKSWIIDHWGNDLEDGTKQSEVVKICLSALSEEDNTMEWIHKPHIYGVTYCSKCDYENKVDDTKFCPNCGRKAVEE